MLPPMLILALAGCRRLILLRRLAPARFATALLLSQALLVAVQLPAHRADVLKRIGVEQHQVRPVALDLVEGLLARDDDVFIAVGAAG